MYKEVTTAAWRQKVTLPSSRLLQILNFISNRETKLNAVNLYSAVPVPTPVLPDFTFIIGFDSTQCRQKYMT
jgi:hypothetical protein